MKYGKPGQRYGSHRYGGKADVCGIYCLENPEMHKCYVGQSKHVYKRIQQHLEALSKGKHENKLMQKDYKKKPIITGKVLEVCSLDKLNEREKGGIDELQTMEPLGYNQGGVPYKRKRKEK